MDKRAPWIITLLLVTALNATQAFGENSFKIITSFSVIEDLVQRVAGSDITITNLIPPEEDVHRWELTPPNVLAIEEADIIFYNGFGLEPWMRHVEAMAHDSLTLTAIAENADFAPLPISVGQFKGSTDPHMWMDPKGAAAYIDVIAHTLSEHYPEKTDAFNTRAKEAHEALAQLDQQLLERLQGIPQTNRQLVTSEAGMHYFARAYEFEYDAIWGVNHETFGSAQAMAAISLRLAEKRPQALFYESTVPCIHMDALAREVNVSLKGPLYVDTLGASDSPAYNYPAMLRHNVEQLHEGLGGARSE